MTQFRFSGLLHVDAAGGIQHFTGRGSETAIHGLATDPEWCTQMRERRISGLRLNGRGLVLLYYPMEDGFVLLIHEGENPAFYDFLACVDFAFDILEHLVSDPFDAMTVVDDKARLRYVSPIHADFFDLKPGEGLGKDVRQVIENTRLHKVVKSGKAEVGQLQRMRGATRVVTRTPIHHEDGRVVGAIGRVMFSSPGQLDTLNRRINSLESEVEFYRREADALRRQDYGLGAIIGQSAGIETLKTRIEQIAPMDVPVLITGESGVGKELVAQAIHRLSLRRDARHVIVNAAALPASLVESELFGYASGAFTGAHQRGHAGKFEQADKGTIFLDEIGDMSLEVQAKLLRVIQDNTVERLGGETPIKLDFRLVTATNRDLQTMVDAGQFRLDLFYRISPVVLHVPPLRERLDDITSLAEHFLTQFADRHGRTPLELGDDALTYLHAHHWPGNVRQLKHEVERAAIFSKGKKLTEADLRGESVGPPTITTAATPPADHDAPLSESLGMLELQIIRNALSRHGNNKKKVAEMLGVSRTYLYKRLAELGIS